MSSEFNVSKAPDFLSHKTPSIFKSYSPRIKSDLIPLQPVSAPTISSVYSENATPAWWLAHGMSSHYYTVLQLEDTLSTWWTILHKHLHILFSSSFPAFHHCAHCQTTGKRSNCFRDPMICPSNAAISCLPALPLAMVSICTSWNVMVSHTFPRLPKYGS